MRNDLGGIMRLDEASQRPGRPARLDSDTQSGVRGVCWDMPENLHDAPRHMKHASYTLWLWCKAYIRGRRGSELKRGCVRNMQRWRYWCGRATVHGP